MVLPSKTSFFVGVSTPVPATCFYADTTGSGFEFRIVIGCWTTKEFIVVTWIWNDVSWCSLKRDVIFVAKIMFYVLDGRRFQFGTNTHLCSFHSECVRNSKLKPPDCRVVIIFYLPIAALDQTRCQFWQKFIWSIAVLDQTRCQLWRYFIWPIAALD